MATKTTKKAPAKKTTAAKKAAPKKTVRTAKAPVTEDIIIMDAHEMHHHDHEHGCGCGGDCGCGGNCGCGKNGMDCGCHGHCACRGGCWGFVKKLFWLLVVFALGFAACMCLCDGRHGGRRGPKMPVEFVNGCLDTTKIACPEFATKVLAADANNDNCITRDEYKAFKKTMRKPRKK